MPRVSREQIDAAKQMTALEFLQRYYPGELVTPVPDMPPMRRTATGCDCGASQSIMNTRQKRRSRRKPEKGRNRSVRL